MRRFFLAAALAAGTAWPTATQARFYHAPRYLMGGYGTTSSLYWNGIWLADLSGTTPSLKHLTPGVRVGYVRSLAMDVDNRQVVMAAGAGLSGFLRSGIYRLDPATLRVTTVLMDTMKLYYPYHLLVDQDGDYLVTVLRRLPTLSYALVRVARDGSKVTTLLTTVTLGARGSFAYDIGVDMDTGTYLVPFGGTIVSSLGTFRNPVLRVAGDGTVVGTFSGPGYAGYWYYDGMEQNFATGDVQWQSIGYLYRLKRGGTFTTVLRYGWMGGQWSMGYNSRFDLQSAATKRLVGDAREYRRINNFPHYLPAVFFASLTTPTAQFVNVDPNRTTGFRYHWSLAFEFYRGRHLGSVKIGANKWRILLSCPAFPGQRYLLALSLSGYRPGIPLRDGRTIHLVPDVFTALSVVGALRPIFDPGPGTLDGNGEARASLDLSSLGGLGVPIWIAALVLDAQGKILYVPDTYVIAPLPT